MARSHLSTGHVQRESLRAEGVLEGSILVPAGWHLFPQPHHHRGRLGLRQGAL